MMMGDTKFYSYKEIPQKDGKIVFGWILSEELSLDQDLIVGYSSDSFRRGCCLVKKGMSYLV